MFCVASVHAMFLLLRSGQVESSCFNKDTYSMPVSLAVEPPQTGGEPRYVKSYLRRGSSSVRLKRRDTLRRSSVSKIQKARARTLKMTIVIGETKIVARGCKIITKQ